MDKVEIDVLSPGTSKSRKIKTGISREFAKKVENALKEWQDEGYLITPMMVVPEEDGLPSVGFGVMFRENKKTSLKYKVIIQEV